MGDSVTLCWGCIVYQGNLDNSNDATGIVGEKIEFSDLFTSESVVTLSRGDIETLVKGENRAKSTLVVLYAPWCQYSQVRLPVSIMSHLSSIL